MRLSAMLLTAFALLAAGCGGDDDEAAETGGGTTTQTTQTTQPDTGTTGTADGACRQVDAPEPKQDAAADAPEGDLDAGKTYSLVFTTNCGSFTVKLDQETAPETSASLVSLARAGFYDNTIFHRIVPGFVIQGGDPTQTGAGGPGYQTVDPPPPTAEYTYGTVAMAKTGAEAPGTSGSQFFVVTAPDAGLPPEYAVVGKISKGLEVVDAIAMLGDQSEQPTQTVLVEQVTVTESGS
jgi:peptidyl-prolyl cis-trans isomerase B (cyclophilin B)